MYATREVEEGRLKEREILQLITKAAPSHRGFAHVVHLLEEFRFESFFGTHTCFVTDVLSFNIPNLQDDLGKRFTLRFSLNITRDVLRGLEYLHDIGVVHSDVKSVSLHSLFSAHSISTLVKDNILIMPTKRAVVSDFGCSQMVVDISLSLGDVTTTTKGTPAFWSPELWNMRGSVRQSKASDVWAFGMTIYVRFLQALIS